MPALLLSLLPLLGHIAPELLGLAFGGNAEAVATKVEAALRDIFGTVDPDKVQAAAQADPSKAEALKSRLDTDTEQLKVRLADIADARAAMTGLATTGSPLAWGSPVISAIVVASFGVVGVFVFLRYGVDSAVGQLIAGALIAKFGTVVDFWLGSSNGASERANQMTALLHQALIGQAPAGSLALPGGRRVRSGS
jgi:hypothetical protein